jgi:hypothetical protein
MFIISRYIPSQGWIVSEGLLDCSFFYGDAPLSSFICSAWLAVGSSFEAD